jgi:molybdenum cofactor cytidylyltransferase
MSLADSGVRCVGLLLAAGRGRRFDASGLQDKLLQSVGGSAPVAAQACSRLRAGTDAVLAVVRPDAPGALHQALGQAQAKVVVCPQADQGMGHSLAHAMRCARDLWPALQAVLVMPADMPWVAESSVKTLAATVLEHPEAIIVPVTAAGHRGHPVAFPAQHFSAIETMQGDEGARSLLARHPVHRIVLDDPGIVRDIDTPADIEPFRMPPP